MKHSNGRYGFTPQQQIWQRVGGSDCETCQGEIRKFSEEVAWNLSDRVTILPGDEMGKYPTLVALGWQRYLDSYNNGFSMHTHERWMIKGFDLLSILDSCQEKQAASQVKK